MYICMHSYKNEEFTYYAKKKSMSVFRNLRSEGENDENQVLKASQEGLICFATSSV